MLSLTQNSNQFINGESENDEMCFCDKFQAWPLSSPACCSFRTDPINLSAFSPPDFHISKHLRDFPRHFTFNQGLALNLGECMSTLGEPTKIILYIFWLFTTRGGRWKSVCYGIWSIYRDANFSIMATNRTICLSVCRPRLIATVGKMHKRSINIYMFSILRLGFWSLWKVRSFGGFISWELPIVERNLCLINLVFPVSHLVQIKSNMLHITYWPGLSVNMIYNTSSYNCMKIVKCH